MPDAVAIITSRRCDRTGKRRYERLSFDQLDRDSDVLAAGLRDMGVERGMRLVLMVRPGADFISLVFAMLKAGIVLVLIDPGMGRKHLLKCLDDVQPDGFVALPIVHALRVLMGRRFAKARHHVTVGRRWFWGGATIRGLRDRGDGDFQPATTGSDDPAAVIFTSGSTGPPKGVLYRHGNFDEQIRQIRRRYDIQPGEIDLAGFPLFGLFNAVMGVTTVVSDMDASHPARADPIKIVQVIHDCGVTQAFGSPALWNVVGRYCEENDVHLPTLRQVLSAGAPVPPHVLRRMQNAIAPGGQIHTPYGATEALPVASISAHDVLGRTAAAGNSGGGTCVGQKFSGIHWQVIRIEDGPLPGIDQAEPLPAGQIGELIVRGPVVTTEYVTSAEANRLSKIADGATLWHRMGDVGYFDKDGRFWFCGRKAHRVLTPDGPMYTIPCEAIFNGHEHVFRSALVGVGPPGEQRPVIVVEPESDADSLSPEERRRLIDELRELAGSYELTKPIVDILIHRSMPVDVRHNAKIIREQLAEWAGRKLAARSEWPVSAD